MIIDPFNSMIKDLANEVYQLIAKQPKRIRILLQASVLLLVVLCVAVIVFSVKNENVSIFGFKTSLLSLVVAGSVAVGFVSAILSYIDNGPGSFDKEWNKLRASIETRAELEKKFRLEKEYLTRLDNDKAGNGTKQDLDDFIKSKVDTLFENSFKDKLEAHYVSGIKKKVQLNQIENQIKELQSGVNVQIGRLSRTGTINLLIGLSTTVVAIIVLLSLILDAKGKHFTNLNEMIPYLLPRAVLAIFIETFSFFFLRLYKDNLEDVKYFHNERTNIDSKVIALKTAIAYGDKETIADAIRSFLAVERNFILKKDETTINIERIKMSNQQEVDLLTKWTDILEKGRKSS
jgi:hypothetical protein